MTRADDEIARRIEERRNDPEFQRKLADAIERSREALDLLAKNDEEQPDLQEPQGSG